MKNSLLKLIAMCLLAIISFNSCKKDKQDINKPVVALSTDSFTGKSGKPATVTVTISSPVGIKSLVITKGVNLQQDMAFGENGTLNVVPETAGQKSWDYTFTYQLRPEEVDKLVGFNFKVIDVSGAEAEKDLTVNTTVSGAQILATYKWNLKSKFDETLNAADFKDCEKDDYYTFNADGTLQYGYGASACDFDGFNAYTGWTLSDDEKVLTITYASIFDPSKVTVDKYNVRALSKDRLILDIAYDLTIFGLSDHEVYVFTYDASNK